MNKTPALLAFLTVCVVLAVLLLAGVVTTIVASLLFAAALFVFGFASRAFHRGKRDQKNGP
jgi:predicted membrane channel-forming protein YqfA (hemolysin III family)